MNHEVTYMYAIIDKTTREVAAMWEDGYGDDPEMIARANDRCEEGQEWVAIEGGADIEIGDIVNVDEDGYATRRGRDGRYNVGDRIEGSLRETDYDVGTVLSVEGGSVTVGWELSPCIIEHTASDLSSVMSIISNETFFNIRDRLLLGRRV